MATTVSSLSNTSAYLRFRQPFVTEGSNQQRIGLGNGVVQGGNLATTGAGNASITIDPDPDTDISVFVYESTIPAARYAVTVVLEGQKTVDMSPLLSTELIYVALVVDYTTTSPTTVEIVGYTAAELAAAPEGADVVIMGTVDMTSYTLGTDTILAADVTPTGRREAWLSGGTKPWTNIVQNGNFDLGPMGVPNPPQFGGDVAEPTPGYQFTSFGTVTAAVSDTNPRRGTYSLELTQTSPSGGIVLRPKSGTVGAPGDLVPPAYSIEPGQRIHAGFYLAGTTVPVGISTTYHPSLQINFADATGATIGSTTKIQDITLDGTFGYTRLEAVIEAPATAVSFTWWMVGGFNVAGAGFFYIDDVFLFVDYAATSDATQATTPFDHPPQRTNSLALVPPTDDRLAAHGATVSLDNEHYVAGAVPGATMRMRQMSGDLFNLTSEGNLRQTGFVKQGDNIASGVDWLECFGDASGTMGGELTDAATVKLAPGTHDAPSGAGSLLGGHFMGTSTTVSDLSTVRTDPSGADIEFNPSSGQLTFEHMKFDQAAGQTTSKFVIDGSGGGVALRNCESQPGIWEIREGRVLWENVQFIGNTSENTSGLHINNTNAGVPLNAEFRGCYFKLSTAALTPDAALFIEQLASVESTLLFSGCVFDCAVTSTPAVFGRRLQGGQVRFENCYMQSSDGTVCLLGESGLQCENVVLDNVDLTSASGGAGIVLDGLVNGHKWDNVRVDVNSASASDALRFAAGSSIQDLSATNCKFDTAGTGDVWAFVQSSATRDIEFRRCEFTAAGGQAIRAVNAGVMFDHCRASGGAANANAGSQLFVGYGAGGTQQPLVIRDLRLVLGTSNSASAGVNSGEPIVFFGGENGAAATGHGIVKLDGLHIDMNGVSLHKDSFMAIDDRLATGALSSEYRNVTIDMDGVNFTTTGSGRGTLGQLVGSNVDTHITGLDASIVEIDGQAQAGGDPGGTGAFRPRTRVVNMSLVNVRGAQGAGTDVRNLVLASGTDFDGLFFNGDGSEVTNQWTEGPVLSLLDSSVKNFGGYRESFFHWGTKTGTGGGLYHVHGDTSWEGQIYRTTNSGAGTATETFNALMFVDTGVSDAGISNVEFDHWDFRVGAASFTPGAGPQDTNFTDVWRFADGGATPNTYDFTIRDCHQIEGSTDAATGSFFQIDPGIIFRHFVVEGNLFETMRRVTDARWAVIESLQLDGCVYSRNRHHAMDTTHTVALSMDCSQAWARSEFSQNAWYGGAWSATGARNFHFDQFGSATMVIGNKWYNGVNAIEVLIDDVNTGDVSHNIVEGDGAVSFVITTGTDYVATSNVANDRLGGAASTITIGGTPAVNTSNVAI